MSESFVEAFEVVARVCASGARFGGFGSLADKAAVSAAPNDRGSIAEHGTILDTGAESAESLFVVFFGYADHAVHGGDFGKAFLFGGIGHCGIGLGPLFVFAGCGGLEMIDR